MKGINNKKITRLGFALSLFSFLGFNIAKADVSSVEQAGELNKYDPTLTTDNPKLKKDRESEFLKELNKMRTSCDFGSLRQDENLKSAAFR